MPHVERSHSLVLPITLRLRRVSIDTARTDLTVSSASQFSLASSSFLAIERRPGRRVVNVCRRCALRLEAVKVVCREGLFCSAQARSLNQDFPIAAQIPGRCPTSAAPVYWQGLPLAPGCGSCQSFMRTIGLPGIFVRWIDRLDASRLARARSLLSDG